jgi:hypothetical protein
VILPSKTIPCGQALHVALTRIDLPSPCRRSGDLLFFWQTNPTNHRALRQGHLIAEDGPDFALAASSRFPKMDETRASEEFRSREVSNQEMTTSSLGISRGQLTVNISTDYIGQALALDDH